MTETHRHFSIAIVGSGFSGLGMAIRLKQNGLEDFTVLERADELGGTWRDNTYPGCACDVESHLYSFSFAPNLQWARMFSGQQEIWEYLKDCARSFGITPHLRFKHKLEAAHWDEKALQWNLETSQGPFTARVLILGMGALSEPKIPVLPGLESFRGKIFHSAEWDHSHDLSGRRVAVIGTGASAIQFVPAIQPKVAMLSVFQRTPPWLVPSVDREITPRERGIFRKHPLLQKLSRLRIYLMREALGVAFRHPKWLMPVYRKVALHHLNRAITDSRLRRLLTPGYTIGCKRILISNDYYPALTRKNVELVTAGIREIHADSVLTEDGAERKIDTIIFGTGFRVTEMPFSKIIFGKNGQALCDAWHGSPKAHLGTMVHGFPNLFLMLGPNTGLGHNSVVLMIETQLEMILKLLGYMSANKLAALEPKEKVQEAYVAELEKRSRKTVWKSGGCMSWYLDKTGRNSSVWPLSVSAFRRRLGRFKSSEYQSEPEVRP